MSKSFKIINQVINEGIIESELDHAAKHNEPFSVALLELDDENTFILKKAIAHIHEMLRFTHLLYEGDGRFIIIIRNTKMANCIKKTYDLLEYLRSNFSFEDTVIGLSESEASDTIKTLTNRINKFFLKAMHSDDGSVFYGTSHYEKSNSGNIDASLQKIFDLDNTLSIYNFYKGLMISEEGSVIKNSPGEITIKLPRQKFLYFMQEKFTYIEHPMIPHITKASIKSYDKLKSTLILSHFQVQHNSPVGRHHKRLEVEKKMPVQIKSLSSHMIVGLVKNISLESILVESKESEIDMILQHGTSFQALFNIHEDDDTIYKIVAPAFFVHRKSKTQIAFTINPTKAQRVKMTKYIANLEKVILFSLRNTLIERAHKM
jgi:valyl-tRNA synthetase